MIGIIISIVVWSIIWLLTTTLFYKLFNMIDSKFRPPQKTSNDDEENKLRILVGEKAIIKKDVLVCDRCGEQDNFYLPQICNICKRECCIKCTDRISVNESTTNINTFCQSIVFTICNDCKNMLNPYDEIYLLIKEMYSLTDKLNIERDKLGVL